MPPFLPLLLILSLHSVLVVLNHPGAPRTDDKVYFEEAKNILSGTWELNESPKNHRFGIILPAAVSIAVFGETGFGIYAWPLLCSLLTLVLLYEFVRRKFGLWNAVLAAGILAVNLDQIIYSGTLFPDVISSFFLFGSGIFLLESSSRWRYGIIAGILFALTIWVRETAFLFIPALVLPFIVFPGADPSRKGLKIFLVVACCGSLVWHVTFALLTGEFSFVYSTVDEHHNKVFADPEKLDFFSRLLVDPPNMIFSSLSLLPLFILSFPALLTSWNMPDKSYAHRVIWFLASILALWVGTTSFTHYSPLPLLERFWIILLPIACILTIQSLSILKHPLFNRIIGASVLIGLTLLAFYFTWKNSVFFAAE